MWKKWFRGGSQQGPTPPIPFHFIWWWHLRLAHRSCPPSDPSPISEAHPITPATPRNSHASERRPAGRGLGGGDDAGHHAGGHRPQRGLLRPEPLLQQRRDAEVEPVPYCVADQLRLDALVQCLAGRRGGWGLEVGVVGGGGSEA